MTVNSTMQQPDSLSIAQELEQSIGQYLQIAANLHASGQIKDAEEMYRAILEIQPHHPDANHGLGLVALQRQQVAAGLIYLEAAVKAKPDQAQYWISYIEALIQAGQEEVARKVLELGKQYSLKSDKAEKLAERLSLHGGSQAVQQVSAAQERLIDKAEPAFKRIDKGRVQPRNARPKNGNKKHGTALPSAEEVNYLIELYNQGRIVEVEKLARSLATRFPQYGFGWKALAIALFAQQRIEEALPYARKAAILLPEDAAAHSNLGITLKEYGSPSEAEASLRRALELNPDYAEAYNNLGVTLKDQERLDEAEASLRRAVELKPDYAEAYSNLSIILIDMGRLAEAEDSLRRALKIRPDYVTAHNNLGIALKEQGFLAESESSFRRALEIKPDYAEAHSSLGVTLRDQGRLAEAEASLRQALALKPNYAEAYNNLGITLKEQGLLAESANCLIQALELKPDWALAYNNLGINLLDQGKLVEAEASFRRALEVKPDYAVAHSGLLFCLSQSEEIDASSLFAEHCRFGEQFEKPLHSSRQDHDVSRDPERCLQIGFVSGDFYNHAVASFIEPVLAHLAGYESLSLHAYYNNTKEDEITQRLYRHFANWHSVVGMNDASLEKKIREDGIDILIDLSGHTAQNRLLTFAHKPAPVQASWMGYPGTTGLRAMDYYLTDRFLMPPGQFDRFFTEKLAYLPANAPFLPWKDSPSVSALPMLANGFLTFGSFNRPSKISRGVVALWSQLLRALPDSRMLLGAMPVDGNNSTLIDWFAQEGIAGQRLCFHPRSDMSDYLALHHKVDICLDTFPYAGGTTTTHALWMGVPTLTIAGDTMPGRQGASIMRQVGLDEFVAKDETDYVKKGLLAASNVSFLAELRVGMRERFERAPVGRPEMIAEGLERVLRIMWRNWCSGRVHASI